MGSSQTELVASAERRELQVGVCRDKEKLVDTERSRIVTARSALNEIKFQSDLDSELVYCIVIV